LTAYKQAASTESLQGEEDINNQRTLSLLAMKKQLSSMGDFKMINNSHNKDLQMKSNSGEDLDNIRVTHDGVNPP
jgi:hypothetical protein